MQEGEILGDYTLDLFGDEDLISIELDLIALELHLILHLGEVKDTREVEGVVYIEVNPEEGLFEGLRVELVVEGDVVFILELGGLLRPSRVNIVDLVVLVGTGRNLQYLFSRVERRSLLRNSSLSLSICRMMSVPRSVRSPFSRVYSGLPSQLQWIGSAPSR